MILGWLRAQSRNIDFFEDTSNLLDMTACPSRCNQGEVCMYVLLPKPELKMTLTCWTRKVQFCILSYFSSVDAFAAIVGKDEKFASGDCGETKQLLGRKYIVSGLIVTSYDSLGQSFIDIILGNFTSCRPAMWATRISQNIGYQSSS